MGVTMAISMAIKLVFNGCNNGYLYNGYLYNSHYLVKNCQNWDVNIFSSGPKNIRSYPAVILVEEPLKFQYHVMGLWDQPWIQNGTICFMGYTAKIHQQYRIWVCSKMGRTPQLP